MLLYYGFTLGNQDLPQKYTSPIEFDFSQLIYPTYLGTKKPYKLSNLEILPQEYDSLVKSFKEDLTQHEKTSLLLYSQTEHISNVRNLTEGYNYLIEDSVPILIPQEYVDIYFLSRFYSIANALKEENSNPLTKEKLNPLLSISDTIFLENCVSKDLELVLDNTINNCFTEGNKENTLSSLVNDLVFSEYTYENKYEEYVKNNLHIYLLNQRISENSEKTLNKKIFRYYFDTDINHLYKIKYISEFLQTVYTQLKIENPQIKDDLKQIEDLTSELMSFTQDSSVEGLSQLAENIVQDENINLFSKAEFKSEKILWYIKSININSKDQLFVSPIHIFKDTTPYALLTFKTNDDNFNDTYEVTPIPQSRNSTRVPILMYHRILPIPETNSKFTKGLYVTPLDFERQLAYLVKHNYKSITPEELYNLLRDGKNPTQKSIMITFDDSTSDQYTNAYPLLKKYGLTGVFYTVSSRSGIKGTQLKEMADNGMIIDSHSSTHKDLTKINDLNQLSYEIIGSKTSITSITKKEPLSIAYPGCVADKEVYPYVKNARYLLGVSCGRSIDHYFSQRLSLSRVHVFTDLTSFVNILSGIN